MPNVNAYCTSADIVAKLPFLLRNVESTKALITEEQITGQCDDIAAEMDSRFRAVGIDTPIDVTVSERLERNIKRIAINGTCASILKSTPNQERYASLQETYEEQYYRDIARIEKDGLGTEGSEKPSGAPSYGPDKYVSAFQPLVPNSLDPTQWGRW